MTNLRSLLFSPLKSLFGFMLQKAQLPNVQQVSKINQTVDKNLFLNGQIASQNFQKIEKLGELADASFSVSSQFGEDGLIEWLVQNLNIEETSFIEFGVETFKEANCRFLMENRNWRGLVFDGSTENIEVLKKQSFYWKYDLTAQDRFITSENINDLIKTAGFAGELGLLSVDIDGVDYWVMDAISCVNPQILILEYNGVFGDLRPITVPYKNNFERHKAHYSGLYYGASLKAMQDLAEQRGYKFVGTPRTGLNAFFVRNDLADKVLSKLDNVTDYPSRYREARDENFNLSYLRGADRFKALENCTVINTQTGQEEKLDQIDRFYSNKWLKAVK